MVTTVYELVGLLSVIVLWCLMASYIAAEFRSGNLTWPHISLRRKSTTRVRRVFIPKGTHPFLELPDSATQEQIEIAEWLANGWRGQPFVLVPSYALVTFSKVGAGNPGEAE